MATTEKFRNDKSGVRAEYETTCAACGCVNGWQVVVNEDNVLVLYDVCKSCGTRVQHFKDNA